MIPIFCSVYSFSKKATVYCRPCPGSATLIRVALIPTGFLGVSGAAGSPRIPFFRGGGGGAVTSKKKKHPTLSAATSGVGEGGGRQLCVHEQLFGPSKRGKHSCVSSGSAISFENGACRSAKKQSWSVRIIVSRPYVPATLIHQSNSETRVLWGEMVNVYSW